MNTKQRILISSIKLFNNNGLSNTRLQHIADDVGISVGNLAYHFYSKEAIVIDIDAQLLQAIDPILDTELTSISLLDFDNHLARYYHLLTDYLFYFIDMLEIKRSYPKLYLRWEQHVGAILKQLEHWLHLKESQGILLESLRPGHYQLVAYTIWMILTFFLSRPIGHNPENTERTFKAMVWAQVLPYLTTAGRAEFDLLIEPLLDFSDVEQLGKQG